MFTWTNLLVVVVELDGNENEALDLVPLVTNVVLEEHHLIVGVVVVVDPGVVPINSRGEKQRMHLRDGFLAGMTEQSTTHCLLNTNLLIYFQINWTRFMWRTICDRFVIFEFLLHLYYIPLLLALVIYSY